jgi:hypothetical protein
MLKYNKAMNLFNIETCLLLLLMMMMMMGMRMMRERRKVKWRETRNQDEAHTNESCRLIEIPDYIGKKKDKVRQELISYWIEHGTKRITWSARTA